MYHTICEMLFSFRKLRKTKFHSQTVLVQLSVSLLCTDVIFLAGIDKTDDHAACLVVAALLHYFLLASAAWMLVEGIVQYHRCVNVLKGYITEHFLLKSSVACWGTFTHASHNEFCYIANLLHSLYVQLQKSRHILTLLSIHLVAILMQTVACLAGLPLIVVAGTTVYDHELLGDSDYPM